MTSRQLKAVSNIKHAANWILGGLENAMYDNPKDSEEYIDAKTALSDHDYLVKILYDSATTEIYGEGSCCFNKSVVQKELRDINFCGKDWLMNECDKRIKKEGY